MDGAPRRSRPPTVGRAAQVPQPSQPPQVARDSGESQGSQGSLRLSTGPRMRPSAPRGAGWGSYRPRSPANRHAEYRRPPYHPAASENSDPPDPNVLFSLQVRLPRRDDAAAVSYARPTEVGYFSFSEDRSLLLNSRAQLKYYHPPSLPQSLKSGFPEKFITRDSKPERLDALLHCLQDINRRNVDNQKPPLAPNFCTWRGLMTKLLCTPYADRDEWELGATLYKGTIYIEEHESEEKINNKFGNNEENKLFVYYGYKFETLSTINVPPHEIESENDPRLAARDLEDVNTKSQFCSVFSTTLGPHTLVCGGEIDCITRDPKPDEPIQDTYVELKTNRVINNDRQELNFARFKLLRMWAQSYLSGVPKIIMGYRDDDGALVKIEQHAVAVLPHTAQVKQARWNPDMCIAFAKEVLDCIKRNVVKEGPQVVYTIRYVPSLRQIQILHPVEGGSQVFIPDGWNPLHFSPDRCTEKHVSPMTTPVNGDQTLRRSPRRTTAAVADVKDHHAKIGAGGSTTTSSKTPESVMTAKSAPTAGAANGNRASSDVKGKGKADNAPLHMAATHTTNKAETRHSDFAAVFGERIHDRIASSRVLMVGAGGIGCELLKNIVLCGFDTIEVVDLDTIDLSNLNRQFLFQSQHIKQSKAKIARESALKFNPAVHVEAHHASIFETRFDLTWFKSFDLVFSALDNVAARRHVNRMCVAADIPLIESGTAGYHGQVAVHHQRANTACYDCHPKPAERKTYPVCTIRSTPSEPIHCVVWAKNYLYAALFGVGEDEEVGGDGDGGIDKHDDNSTETAQEIAKLKAEAGALKRLRETMSEPGFARRVFDKVFGSDIRRLLDMDGLWNAHKRPKLLDYDAVLDDDDITGMFDPSSLEFDQRGWNVRQSGRVFVSSIESLSRTLLDNRQSDPTAVLTFDKDDEPSLNFVAAAANLRAECFSIPHKSRFDVKQMAGNIIPAIATTNAIVAGMMVMLAVKVLARRPDQLSLAGCTNTYVNYGGERPHLLSNESMPAPNPACSVCSVTYLGLKINTRTSTLRDIVDNVLIAGVFATTNNVNDIRPDTGLGLSGEISIQRDESLLYDIEFDDNLDKTLTALSIEHGKTLTVTNDVDTDTDPDAVNVAVTLFIEHRDDADAGVFEIHGTRRMRPRYIPETRTDTVVKNGTDSNAVKRGLVTDDDLVVVPSKRMRVDDTHEIGVDTVVLDAEDEMIDGAGVGSSSIEVL